MFGMTDAPCMDYLYYLLTYINRLNSEKWPTFQGEM